MCGALRVVTRLSDCVRLCVCWCPLWCPFLCKGRCAESPHTGLSQRAIPKGETPATASTLHNGLTTTPSAVRYESGSRATCSLPARYNHSTETSDRMCQSVCLVSRADLSLRLCITARSCHFAASGHVTTHGFRATAPLSRESLEERSTSLCHRAEVLIFENATPL